MYKLALIGYPLSHSMSKVMHEAAFKSTGLEGSYELLETPPEDFVPRLKSLKTDKYNGFNVTIPHKVPITLFLDDADDVANLAGSVNTVKILPDYTMHGYNTDVYGFVKAIPDDFARSLKDENAAVLGLGGAARAVGTGLAQLKLKKIDFYVRNIVNASNAANILRTHFSETEIECKQIESLKTLEKYKIAVNTTPLGMRGKAMGISPIDEDVVKTMKEGSAIYDIVYNPVKTELIKYAKRQGIMTIGGLDMLVYQGAKAFEIWTGKTPDAKMMKLAALEQMVE